MPSRCLLSFVVKSWPDWGLGFSNQPTIICPLSNGRTNRSYVLDGDQQKKYILRLNHPKPKSLGINRQHEKVILETLNTTGISPKMYFSASDFSYTVLEYLPGTVWTQADFRSATQRSKLYRLIDQYQQEQPEVRCFDYVQYLQNYWSQLIKGQPRKAAQLRNKWQTFIPRLRLFQKNQKKWLLVHHDLVPENIIEHEGRLKIIDWEYAGLGFSDLDKTSVDLKGRLFQRRTIARELVQWIDTLWWAVR